MSQYVTLLGADDVSSAARTMESAADRMINAACTIDDALRRHQWFMDGWLARFEAAVDTMRGQNANKHRATEADDD